MPQRKTYSKGTYLHAPPEIEDKLSAMIAEPPSCLTLGFPLPVVPCMMVEDDFTEVPWNFLEVRLAER